MLLFGSSSIEINKYLNTFIFSKNKDIIDSINQSILVVPVITGIILLVVLYYIYKKYERINYADYDPDKYSTYENNYKGFKGFFLLFAVLVIILNPISSILNFISDKFCYSTLLWDITTTYGMVEYSSWWASILKMIPILDIIELILSFFLAFLLVKRKRFFRKVFWAFIFFEIMNFGIRDLYFSQIFPVGSIVKVSTIESLSIIYQIAFISGLYVYFSKAIHSTLRR